MLLIHKTNDLITPNDRRVVIVLEGEFENESVIGEVNMLFVGVQGKLIKGNAEVA